MTQLQKSGVFYSGRFELFLPVKKFIKENKQKNDPAPEVGGILFWSFWIVFTGEKIY